MFCKNCGNEIQENGAFCSKCGANIEAPVQQNERYQSSSPYNNGTDYSSTTSKAQIYFTISVVSIIASVLFLIIGFAVSSAIMALLFYLAFCVSLLFFTLLERRPDEEKTDGMKLFIRIGYIIMAIMAVIHLYDIFNS